MKKKNLGAGAAVVENDTSVATPERQATAVELGCPGHLIVSRSCHWRRHTQIGKAYRVSTLGDYYPSKGNQRGTLGAEPDSFFETMVFKTTDRPELGSEGCGCYAVESYDGLECRRYATAGQAQEGHERFVREYAAKAAAEGR